MKTAVIVAPHFLPSFLASVHRARLWSYHLAEFGWRPIVVTTHFRYYECQLDWDMMDLLSPDLEVIRTRAFPTRPIRVVGDIGIRSLPWYFSAIRELKKRGKVDFVHITIPEFTAALLGRKVKRRLGVAYGIDYIDPWVPESRPDVPLLGKRWIANKLARVLEPYAVRRCSLITGISRAYFESVFQRNPQIQHTCGSAAMPYGGSERDYEALGRKPRPLFLFDPLDGCRHLIYAGALLPKGIDVLNGFLRALKVMDERSDGNELRLKVHFVGTGRFQDDASKGHGVLPMVKRLGLEHLVEEYPKRISYLDVLNHLRASDGILILGSSERHYSPSKIYQAVLARKAIFAILHEDSSAVQSLQRSNAGHVVTFAEGMQPDPVVLANLLFQFLAERFDPSMVDRRFFSENDARTIAGQLAAAFDEAWLRNQTRHSWEKSE